MKLGIVALGGLLTMGTALAVTGPLRAATQLVTAQANQPATVEPQQNDLRAAIARVNPKQPIQVRVISRTNVPVVTTVASVTDDRPVAPGQTVTFGRLHTSYLSLPLDLQVSLQNNPDPAKPIGVFLDVKTVGNEVILGVKTSITPSGASSRAIRVDKQGSIYLY